MSSSSSTTLTQESLLLQNPTTVSNRDFKMEHFKKSTMEDKNKNTRIARSNGSWADICDRDDKKVAGASSDGDGGLGSSGVVATTTLNRKKHHHQHRQHSIAIRKKKETIATATTATATTTAATAATTATAATAATAATTATAATAATTTTATTTVTKTITKNINPVTPMKEQESQQTVSQISILPLLPTTTTPTADDAKIVAASETTIQQQPPQQHKKKMLPTMMKQKNTAEYSKVSSSSPSVQVLKPGQFRFHIPGVAHTIANADFCHCPFTQKSLRFCKMMTEKGHIVIFYGHPDSEVQCTELVPVITREFYNSFYNVQKWKTQHFLQQEFTNSEFRNVYDQRVIEEIQRRKALINVETTKTEIVNGIVTVTKTTTKNTALDFLLCFFGIGELDIVRAHYQDFLVVEPGIGYPTTIPRKLCPHKIYESYSKMNIEYTSEQQSTPLPLTDDAVIPMSFEWETFKQQPLVDITTKKTLYKGKGYFLFVGRIIYSKGLTIAIDITRLLNIPLVVAGQGKIRDFYETQYDIAHVEEIGVINEVQKAQWMAEAFAVFVPTLYSEAFGAVALETLFVGTPIITTDTGAFAEYCLHDKVGYRCRTLNEFLWAARLTLCGRISGPVCRQWALDNYSTERMYSVYENYFQNVWNNKKKGTFYFHDEIDLEKDQRDKLQEGALVPCLRQRVVHYPTKPPTETTTPSL